MTIVAKAGAVWSICQELKNHKENLEDGYEIPSAPCLMSPCPVHLKAQMERIPLIHCDSSIVISDSKQEFY